MSHSLDMYASNKSDMTLSSFSITHTWDGDTDNLNGTNLIAGASSPPQNITSGYTEYDWYTIQVTFENGVSQQANFYCNSSYSQNAVYMDIYSDTVSCLYFADDTYETGCPNKSWT
jgi:hypothetical protein